VAYALFDTPAIHRILNLPASPAAEAALYTSAAGVSRWWGPTEGDGAAGGMLVTSFGDYGVNAMRVLEAGPTRVVWESIASGATTPTGHTQERLGTTMEFDIAGAGAGTELRFRHAGLTPQLESGRPAPPPGPPSWRASRLRQDRHRHPVRGLRH
jgi:hypothetical protein